MICFREDLRGRFEMKIHFKMMKSLSEGNHELWWYRSVIAGRAQGNAFLLLKAGRGKRKQAARIRLFLREKSRYCSLPVHNADFVWRWALHLPACTLLWESLLVVFCLMGFLSAGCKPFVAGALDQQKSLCRDTELQNLARSKLVLLCLGLRGPGFFRLLKEQGFLFRFGTRWS